MSADLHGVDIAGILNSKGPVVKAVLLRHMRKDGKDGKPHPASPKADEKHKRVVLTEDIEEIEIDTTPSKNMVKSVLGGPFTFLGQYEEEGTMVMIRKELPDDLETLSIAKLRELCADYSIDTSSMLEKQEMIDALAYNQLPVNPHQLQPPFDGVVVRGDILLMRVAATEEPLDEEEGEDEAKKEVKALSNEEFFLDYTKEEYVAFASRTDVVAPEVPSDADDDEDEDEDDDDEDDEDYQVGEDEDEEEEKKAMLNLVLSEVIKKFRQENGRGPDTEELLELRSQIAKQLGVEVATVSDVTGETDKKRPVDANGSEMHSPKKVKFGVPGSDDDDDDKKPAASGDAEDA